MSDILSAEEIDALFDQASSGRPVAEPAESGQGRRERWLRTVDFTRPSKFGIDPQRRLRRIGVDDPVDLFVDGMRCASGRLMVGGDGTLQLAIEGVLGLKNAPAPADQQETVIDSPTVQMEV